MQGSLAFSASYIYTRILDLAQVNKGSLFFTELHKAIAFSLNILCYHT